MNTCNYLLYIEDYINSAVFNMLTHRYRSNLSLIPSIFKINKSFYTITVHIFKCKQFMEQISNFYTINDNLCETGIILSLLLAIYILYIYLNYRNLFLNYNSYKNFILFALNVI